MRFRLMATYRGVPYEVGVGPSSSEVVLFAACPPPEELGFEPAPGHWRKQVIRAEVDVLWESRPVGRFHGDPCLVLDDLGDRLHIAYLGKDGRRARELGFWQVDRGVYELLTPREEVTGLNEEKVEKSLPRRGPANGAQPLPSYPYDSPQWPPAPAASGSHLDPRTRDSGPGYVSEPAMAPAGAWNGSGPPPGTGSWNGNGTSPAGTGGWNVPGSPTDSGSWNRDATPADSGSWNRDAIPASPSGWNGNGSPAGTGGWSPAGVPAAAAGANGHGAGGWNGMAGPDGTLGAPAPPMPGRRRQAPKSGRRSARKQRIPTRAIFSELADLAAIPRSAYALEQESDGAICLLRTGEGFEVFSAAEGARHEVRSFDDEEAAYFYLFGVLSAEALRNGRLTPRRG
jgi:hypothetical protein